MTLAQDKARKRNHVIMRLRGAFHICSHVPEPRAGELNTALENCLVALGAQTNAEKREQSHRELLFLMRCVEITTTREGLK
jgi:hypothetical protein